MISAPLSSSTSTRSSSFSSTAARMPRSVHSSETRQPNVCDDVCGILCFLYTIYAVGDPAFGRVVLCLLLCLGFCALRAQKPGCPLAVQIQWEVPCCPRRESV